MTHHDINKFKIINKNPIIFDLGGHNGDWVQIAIDKYPDSTIYVFEPIKKYYDMICKRFSNKHNIKIFNFAISSKTYETEMSDDGDTSSMHFCSGSIKKELIKVKDIMEFLSENQINHVDLIKINIEGEEYNLLEHLINNQKLFVFKNYAVQFHINIENYIVRRSKILDEVKKYYDVIFNVDFVWEFWSVK